MLGFMLNSDLISVCVSILTVIIWQLDLMIEVFAFLILQIYLKIHKLGNILGIKFEYIF
jgi:hypothetical protein